MATPGQAPEPKKENEKKPPVESADSEGKVESGPNPGSDSSPKDSGGANL